VWWFYTDTDTDTHTQIHTQGWAKGIRHHGLGLKVNKNMHKYMGC